MTIGPNQTPRKPIPSDPERDNGMLDPTPRSAAADFESVAALVDRFDSRLRVVLSVEFGSQAIAGLDRADFRRRVIERVLAASPKPVGRDVAGARWRLQQAAREVARELLKIPLASSVAGERAIGPASTPAAMPGRASDARFRALLEKALSALPERYRLLLEMRVRRGATIAEAAQALGTTDEVAATLERRAVVKLREEMRRLDECP
ncbi:MAG: sigma factor-like helix-turn-helix DNA-binding protein [Planctomycetota bacterium]